MTSRLPFPAFLGPFREWSLLFVGNCFVAAFLSVMTDFGLVANLVYSQCIGFSIGLITSLACRLRGRAVPGGREVALGVLLGGLSGFALGALINGHTSLTMWQSNQPALVAALASVFTFGALMSLIFYHRMQASELAAQVQAERLRQAEHEKHLQTARLQVLQARIEPHFLFNTLSNVVCLIDFRPEDAKDMLLHLTDLLRAHLAEERQATLGSELDLLRAYLGVMQIRMGPRLSWRIEAPPELLECPLPPFLLQPLVENALHHGLEPKAGDGRLSVACSRRGGQLEIAVADDGLGLLAPSPNAGSGMGLANVRERLFHAYGPAARLELAGNPGGGASCRLTLPLEAACAS